MHKVQGECEYVLKQASAAAEKQETLSLQLVKLTKSLEQTEESIRKSTQEAKVRHVWNVSDSETCCQHMLEMPSAPAINNQRYCLPCMLQALSQESMSVERSTQRIFQEVRSLEAEMLRTLSEQTSTEKSSSKTAADIKALRAAAEAEEMVIAEVQNELARLAVDALNTQGHNDRLRQALQLLDAELKDKVSLKAEGRQACCNAA